ncbi:unnamed protein product, partial [Ectocarpus sp. 12 AP-2014]
MGFHPHVMYPNVRGAHQSPCRLDTLVATTTSCEPGYSGTMLCSTCFRQASYTRRALTSTGKACLRRGLLGSSRSTAAAAGDVFPHERPSSFANGRRIRPAETAPPEGRRLWTSSAVTRHLDVGEGRCLSQDSGNRPHQHAGDEPVEKVEAVAAAAPAAAAKASQWTSRSDAPSHNTAAPRNSRIGGLGTSNDAKAKSSNTVFRLCSQFVDREGRGNKPQFGFNGLGELVYQRTYARYLGEDTDDREQWYQTVERVVNGTFSMQKEWMLTRGMRWDEQEAQSTAQEMYRRMFAFKFLPPGRGLWAMGSKLTTERRLYAALNNCAFVSTRGAGTIDVMAPGSVEGREGPSELNIVVDDSREGWRDAFKLLLEAYFFGHQVPVLDVSNLRPAGAPIRGFGGVSQGSAPLVELMASVKATLDPLIGKPLSVTAIVDLMNKVGVCVVAGNVRRTAEIAFGDPGSDEYIDLKNYDKNPDRASFGWASNNSVLAPLGMDYTKVCERIQQNGEPGFAWLENMRTYGRMGDEKNDRDSKAMGGNPCLEQTLESFEMCCLVETFPDKHESLEDFLTTLSMSGLAQFVAAKGLGTLQEWCEEGYEAVSRIDEDLSTQFGIPTSIKTTSIKPSGTVSLLAGATPGMHYPESRFYIRRVRMASDADVLGPLREAGYRLEPAAENPEGTMVVEVPVDAGEGVRTAQDLSMWEQLSFAAFLQRYWADNQASFLCFGALTCTITFDPETEGKHLAHALDYFQYQLKGVSFLPRTDYGAFPQV